MRLLIQSILFVSFLFTAKQTLAQEEPQQHPDKAALEEFLSAQEGIEFEEFSRVQSGYISYQIRILQPEDHQRPEAKQFKQLIYLHHRSFDAPMVLQTSGYSIFGSRLSALAQTTKANQIQVEHRFFRESIAQQPNWELLNVEESAADFHRITTLFKEKYSAKWAGTGRSKGGMTSVYHRRFYPDDIDLTVAHVAPMSFSTEDKRYEEFLSNAIGGEPFAACREKLEALQRNLMTKKGDIPEPSGDFNLLGSKAVAIEHAVVELSWAFWQYSSPRNQECSNVPTSEDSWERQRGFLSLINSPSDYADASLSRFTPYFHQASTQLGSPASYFSHLEDLMDFSDSLRLDLYIPDEIELPYDDSTAMQDVSRWVKEDADGILFVYGAHDPWTAGAFEIEDSNRTPLYVVPEKNHGAQFIDLNGEDSAAALAFIKERLDLEDLNITKPATAESPRIPTLEDLEFRQARIRGI